MKQPRRARNLRQYVLVDTIRPVLRRLRQRVVVALAVATAAAWWLVVAPWLEPAGGGGGLVVMDAEVGVVAATVAMVIGLAPGLGFAALLAKKGRPLAAMGVVTAGLALVACLGGGSEGFLHRHLLPGGYLLLVVEAGVLMFGLAGVLVVVQRMRPAGQRERVKLLPVVVSGLTTLAAGAVLTHALVRTADAGQICGGLLVAFFVGGLVGQMVAPSRLPVAALLSPLLLAMGSYIWMLRGELVATDAVLARLYAGELSGLVLPLPLHYASAGVLGVALGSATGQTIEVAPDRRSSGEATHAGSPSTAGSSARKRG